MLITSNMVFTDFRKKEKKKNIGGIMNVLEEKWNSLGLGS